MTGHKRTHPLSKAEVAQIKADDLRERSEYLAECIEAAKLALAPTWKHNAALPAESLDAAAIFLACSLVINEGAASIDSCKL